MQEFIAFPSRFTKLNFGAILEAAEGGLNNHYTSYVVGLLIVILYYSRLLIFIQQDKATDPIKYFAAPENQDLRIVKRQRDPNVKLIIAPFTDKQRGSDQFFCQASSQRPLTTATGH